MQKCVQYKGYDQSRILADRCLTVKQQEQGHLTLALTSWRILAGSWAYTLVAHASRACFASHVIQDCNIDKTAVV